MKKKIKTFFLFGGALAVVFLVWIVLVLSYRVPQTTTIYFEPGTSLRQISSTLQENKVIKSTLFFEFLARIKGDAKKIKAGEYEFKAGMRAFDILQMVVEGKVVLHPFTVPEGFTIHQMVALLKARQDIVITDPADFALFADGEFAKKEGIPAESFEGYLFPDTYFLERKTHIRELIPRMLGQFKKKITPDLIEKAKVLGLSLHQWVTLASIIEKETGAAFERPLVASVFLNRLKIGMPLQSDPTVIYGIPDFSGNLTRKDLEADTPYNTYTRNGLPPGPICSPGFASLMAVLNPVQTDYLYFVGKGDGTHYFSKTLEEHNRAVMEYQINKAKQKDMVSPVEP